MITVKSKNERLLGDGVSVQGRKEASVVAIVVNKMQVFVGKFDLVVGELGREFRRENELLLLLLLPHRERENVKCCSTVQPSGNGGRTERTRNKHVYIHAALGFSQ